MAQLQTFTLEYSEGSAKFAAATKNSDAKAGPEDLIDTKLMLRFGQFYKRPECLTENYCRNSVDFSPDGSHHTSRRGYTLKTERWIPHMLACELKQDHLSMRL
jgi:hypothetical protein